MTLSVWTTENDPATLKVLNDVGTQVAASSPEVKKVEVTAVNWSELNVKLQQAFEAGRMPGIVHLAPVFTKYFVDQDLLLPVDDIVKELGEDDIHAAVRKVAYFNGHYYGIPQHFAASYMIYNKRLFDAAGVKPPTTWQEMLKAAKKLTNPKKKQYGIYFPGGDRFFVDSIFFEALASVGGKVFKEDGSPNLTDPKVINTLQYLKELVKYASPADWQTATYMSGFDRMVREEVAINLMVGARSAKSLEKNWDAAAHGGVPAQDVFLPLDPPRSAAGVKSFASVDCEPYAIINQKKNKGTSATDGKAIENASRQYLRALFRRDNYVALTNSVPIGLIPIFKSMVDEQAKTEYVKRWKPWFDHALVMVEQERLNPFLTVSFKDLEVTQVFEMFGAKIVSEMVLTVLSGTATPEAAAKSAQTKAEQLLRR